MDKERRDHLQRFDRLLGRLDQTLGGARRLADCSGRLQWPARGIYFFIEDGEHRSDGSRGGKSCVWAHTPCEAARAQPFGSGFRSIAGQRGQAATIIAVPSSD